MRLPEYDQVRKHAGGSGWSIWVETPSTMQRDTNDTKSMASDIGTIPKGRMVA
jgi:hypothetical protein